MDNQLQSQICRLLGAVSVQKSETVQTLWSGYGEIIRVALAGHARESVIVKHIRPQRAVGSHPRGWNTDVSHNRKLRSYEVESAWYRSWSHHCGAVSRVPDCYGCERDSGQTLLILEDLNASGYSHRYSKPTQIGMKSCLSWLAGLHATFLIRGETVVPNRMHSVEDELWEKGTYWHLDTRPDEWERMESGTLKDAARELDRLLSECPYRTLVHGDAKVANFCFTQDQACVAAVDFQYVGGGCGIQDVAYFLGSCLSEVECQREHASWLDYYFEKLQIAIGAQDVNIDVGDLESQWRGLFPVAWADFHRFLLGWCPTHPKLTGFSDQMVTAAMRIVDAKT